ncbi:hypothetical protein TNCV_531061 [Trichonephila clavipes]|nr:hypothetical protein TNCV_531061 [Trichonephila clavipes]
MHVKSVATQSLTISMVWKLGEGGRAGHEVAAAHLGVTKTKDAIFKTIYWPKRFSDVEDFVKICDTNVKRVGKPQDKKKVH